MSSLLDLPNEIVILIANLVYAADIESFSLCNKHVYWLSEETLKKHERMKAQYGELHFGAFTPGLSTRPYNRDLRTPNPIFFLRTILDNENLAHYPTNIYISELFGEVQDWTTSWQGEMQEMIMNALADCRDSITAKVEGCPYIVPEKRQCWRQEIFGGSEATLVALMVLYLPNLRSITFANTDWGNLDRLQQLIANIAAENRADTQKTPRPLSKLSHLGLECVYDDNVYDALLPRWLPIIGLPSLRRFSGVEIVGHDLEWSEPSLGAEIIDISVTRSDIDVKTFKSLFSNVKALQTFKYSCEGADDNIPNWEPRSILQMLQIHAAHSLESLDLTVHSGEGPVYFKIGTTFVDCLPDFQALKRVRVHHSMFMEKLPMPMSTMNRPKALDLEVDTEAAKAERRFHRIAYGFRFKKYRRKTLDLEVETNYYGTAEKRIHRLVDLLPASIEIVDLVYPLRGKAEALAMMGGLPELKQSRLPHLRGLRLEVNDNFDSGMKASFRKAGIDLVWWKVRNAAARNRREWQGKRLGERVEGHNLMDTLGVEGLDTMLAVLGVE